MDPPKLSKSGWLSTPEVFIQKKELALEHEKIPVTKAQPLKSVHAEENFLTLY